MADKHETAYLGMLQAAGLAPADSEAPMLVTRDDVRRVARQIVELQVELVRLKAENADLTCRITAARGI